jgi:exocyst complex component 4
VENVRERLRDCKNLLLLKRQDIRKLWLSTSEQNALVRIYQNLDQLKQVPKRLEFYLSKRLYVHASLLLLKAREHQELRLFNALSDIDLQIREERLALEDQLRLELIDQLFDKPCRDILGHKNLSSTTNTSLNKNDQNSLSRLRENRLLRKQLDQDFEEGKLLFESVFLSIIPDKYLLVDIRFQSPDLYLDVLLQSLSILSHLNETLDSIQKQLPEQLYRIILRTTQHIIDNNFILSNNSQTHTVNNPDCLKDLLETCYEQFKLVVKNVYHLLNMLTKLQEHQAPLQIQLKEYLERQNQPGLLQIKSNMFLEKIGHAE